MSMHPKKNYFKDFQNKVFVETGSYRGDAIKLALDAGFKKIISVDIVESNINFCKNRFDLYSDSHDDIIMIHGDSALCLYDAIKDIDEPITFWLDGHSQMFEDEEPGENPFPLLDELKQISKHHIKTHTILIDDMLIMQDNIVLYNKYIIENMLYTINADYKFEYRANPVINNILIAHV